MSCVLVLVLLFRYAVVFVLHLLQSLYLCQLTSTLDMLSYCYTFNTKILAVSTQKNLLDTYLK